MEWNGGVDYWSGVLDWTTGVPRPQNYSISYSSMASCLEKQLKNRSKVVWGAMPNPGTQTRSKVKNISSKVTSHTDSSPGPLSQLLNVTRSACLACEMYLHTKQYTVSMPDN